MASDESLHAKAQRVGVHVNTLTRWRDAGWDAPTVEAVARIRRALSTQDVAALLGRHRNTIARWRAQGTGPRWHPHPATGVPLYDPADLIAWQERTMGGDASREPAE